MISSNFSKFLWDLSDAFKTGIVKTPEERDYLIKYLFAKEFGWTPDQVDNMSYKDVEVFLKLIEIDKTNQEYLLNKELGGGV